MNRFATNPQPIFVQGILQRSGTNYLNNLLLLHADIRAPGMVWEDFLAAHADKLAEYERATYARWNPQWVARTTETFGEHGILRFLGAGLLQFMEAQHAAKVEKGEYPPIDAQPAHLVTATPNANNLSLIKTLFPNAGLIIIVRDGHALIESGVRSFGWDYEEAMRMWVRGAENIEHCLALTYPGITPLLVKYESLVNAPRAEMLRILRHLGMDEHRYDFDACENLGVMGSSELKQRGTELHWKFEKKPQNFNPLARARDWPIGLQRRFNHVAGAAMTRLGYSLNDVPANAREDNILDRVYGLEAKLRARHRGLAERIRQYRDRRIRGAK